MAQNKTQFTKMDVNRFLKAIPDDARRKDAFALLRIMQELTGSRPQMYGPTIVGFGRYHYRYPSGREGDAPLAAFSPRRPELVVYLDAAILNSEPELWKRLGKHRATRVCLYIRRLADIHLPTLKQLIRRSVAHVQSTHG
jgi:hypothetical protein